MGKEDRYDFEGAEDSLGGDASGPPSSPEMESGAATETPAVEDMQDTSTSSDVTESGSDSTKADRDEIPHRVRYDSPKDGRKAKTFYLDQDRDLAHLRELHSLAESEFSEKVHRLDVYLAAFRSDLSDESFLKEMRHIGYGYFD